MRDIDSWIDSLQCPDCQAALQMDSCSAAQEIVCFRCDRKFESSGGVWNLLPSHICQYQGKESEKDGWYRKAEDGTPPSEYYMALPYVQVPYYEVAARHLEVVLEYAKPWVGKKVLELGAAECWATRRFAEAGAEAVGLDYSNDPHRMGKAQIFLDHLPIHFLRIVGDGEQLPFQADTFDRIFCCSVLHHFFDVSKAVREISRILKPGGIFIAILEAFHPPYLREKDALARNQESVYNLSFGINERSYTARFYQRVFNNAGLKFELLNPCWDLYRRGSSFTVEPGAGLPDVLERRAAKGGLTGGMARLLSISPAWQATIRQVILPRIRFPVLSWTQKEKIIIGRKLA